MTTLHSGEDVADDSNHRALEELAWAIEGNVGQFALILARCNSASLRERLVQRLQELCSVEIREIVLKKSVKTLYTAIQTELGQEQPQALIVCGLESVTALDPVLTGANQIREEFRKNFHFPLVWWVTDEVLQKLIRLAPDFQSWATTVEFEIATDELIQFIQQTADEVFAKVLDVGAGVFLDDAALNLGVGSPLRAELESAGKELQHRGVKLDLALEASLEFVLGRVTDGSLDRSRQHYERSLDLWQQQERSQEEAFESDDQAENLKSKTGPQDEIPERQNPKSVERRGCVLYTLAIWWGTYAVKHRAEYEQACGRAKDYLRQCIEVFEQHYRNDLVAKFINGLGVILQQLQQWDELETVARKALALHQTYSEPFRLARAYGFLAEVHLAKSAWIQAMDCARQALAILNMASSNPSISVSSQQSARLDWELSSHQGWYLFALGRAQQSLGLAQEAIINLETARKQTKPQYDPELYIRILKELRDAYFEQGDYLTAFRFKQDQRGIESEYGFRAFIGADWLRPSQQVANPALTLGESQGTIAREIAASGRQKDVEFLRERIGRIDHKLTIIYGQSGVGKSSTLQAGLIPALKQKPIGTCDVATVLQRAYTDWIRELGQNLVKEIEELEKKFQLSRGTLLLSEALDSTAAILEQLKKNAEENLLTVLIFDQFEEFFFVCKDPTLRQTFYEFLRQCLESPFVKVILSLREDYLHYLLEFNRKVNLEVLNNNILDKNILYYLGNFFPADAKLVMQGLTAQTQFSLEESLIDKLVQDLAGELGEVRPIELQVVGAQLQTENITKLTQYREYGLKSKLVERYLEEVVEDCGSPNKQVSELILYLLTDENNTRPLKTRDDLEKALISLAADLAAEAEKFDLVLDIFVLSGLVVLLPERPTRYQLVHDYLVSFIRQQQNTELIKKLKEAEKQKKLSDAKLNRFLKMALVGSIATALVFAVLTVVSVVSAWQARNSEFHAKSANSESLFALNKQLEALVESLKIGIQLKQAVGVEKDTKVQALNVLQKVVYGVREYNRLVGHGYAVFGVSFSPDGQTIASASADNTVRLWRRDGSFLRTLQDPKDIRKQTHKDGAISVNFSSDGKTIASTGQDKTIKLWSLDGTLLKILIGHQKEVYSASFSPDGKLIASASDDQTVKLWRRDGTLVNTLIGHKGTVLCVRFSPDGKMIASASADKTVRLWRRDGTFITTLKGHNDHVFSVSFSPDAKFLASASKDNTVKLWRRDGIFIRSLDSHTAGVRSVSFSPDGKTIASASADNTVKLWKVAETKVGGKADSPLTATLQGHNNVVTSVSFSPDGQTIASASTDNTVRLWRLPKSMYGKTLSGHTSQVNSVSFSPDGKMIASASTDTKVKLWKQDGTLFKDLLGHPDPVWSVSFSPDGKTIASTSADKTVRLWRDGTFITTLQGHNNVVTSVSFSPDGKTIASASTDKTVKLWRLDGTLLRNFSGHRAEVWSVSFSPNGKTIASASADHTVKLWRTDGTLLKSLQGHTQDVQSVSFSPDGKTIASASNDKTVKIWNQDGKMLKTLSGHTDVVRSVSFSPDGKIIASGSDDQTVKVWSLDGQLLKTLSGHSNAVRSVSFSPDGKTIASASKDRTVILWNWKQWDSNVDDLLLQGCHWARDYLKTNPNVEESDRHLCDNISPKK